VAFTIIIPGIIRLVVVKRPGEVVAINDASMVQRSLSGRGGLANRSIAAKLAIFRTPDGDIWPAFRDRLDPLRAMRQEALEAALSDIELLLRRIAPEIAELGGYVRDGAADRNVGVIVQQAVGRLFFDDYAASDESYEAARTLQTWLSAWPLRAYWIRRSGALQASLDRIMDLSRGDVACAHATALAMENIVRSIELMRQLACHDDNLAKIEPQDALAHSLRAPARVLREARDGGRAGPVRLPARSLVLVRVESSLRQHPVPSFAFFASAWNRCPAHSVVPALLAGVWQVARANAGGLDLHGNCRQ
jgi:hypothetical protein